MKEQVINQLKEHGVQSWVARKTGIHRTTVVQIWNGKRRATPTQAALLENLFTQKAIPLNRWDLLYAEDADGGIPSIIYILENKFKKGE